MNIFGLQKTTLLDFPGHLAATVFTGGCNFCCPFCHNSALITPHTAPSHRLSPDEVLSFLHRRRNLLEGVCITGGEPTLQPDLEDFLSELKKLGYLIKLDTNGYRPDVLMSLAQKDLIDYVAMDIKSSPENYGKLCGLAHPDLSLIQKSIDFLMNSFSAFEFRTTVVKTFHTPDDIISIGRWLKGEERYFIQNFKASDSVLAPGLSEFSPKELQYFKSLLQEWIPYAAIRGDD